MKKPMRRIAMAKAMAKAVSQPEMTSAWMRRWRRAATRRSPKTSGVPRGEPDQATESGPLTWLACLAAQKVRCFSFPFSPKLP
jgi:hypothetical protein